MILIIGILAGGALITVGAMKTAEANKINEERQADALVQSEADIAAAEQRLSDIETEKTSLESAYNAKQRECNSLDMTAPDWFTVSSQCQEEASSIQDKINKLKMEEFSLKNADYEVYYEKEQPEKYIAFYIFGAFCVIAGVMISLSVFLITKRRAILAYGVQSTMPVGKEAIEKYTPTVAKAAGDVAGSVAEGIARGAKNGKTPTTPKTNV